MELSRDGRRDSSKGPCRDRRRDGVRPRPLGFDYSALARFRSYCTPRSPVFGAAVIFEITKDPLLFSECPSRSISRCAVAKMLQTNRQAWSTIEHSLGDHDPELRESYG